MDEYCLLVLAIILLGCFASRLRVSVLCWYMCLRHKLHDCPPTPISPPKDSAILSSCLYLDRIQGIMFYQHPSSTILRIVSCSELYLRPEAQVNSV